MMLKLNYKDLYTIMKYYINMFKSEYCVRCTLNITLITVIDGSFRECVTESDEMNNCNELVMYIVWTSAF